MAKQSAGFNIKDLVQEPKGKPSKTHAKKKQPKAPPSGGGDSIGQPTPMPSGMGMGMGGY